MKDAVGNGDFADVVEEAAALESDKFRARETEGDTEGDAVSGEALAVFGGVGIAGFDGLSERE